VKSRRPLSAPIFITIYFDPLLSACVVFPPAKTFKHHWRSGLYVFEWILLPENERMILFQVQSQKHADNSAYLRRPGELWCNYTLQHSTHKSKHEIWRSVVGIAGQLEYHCCSTGIHLSFASNFSLQFSQVQAAPKGLQSRGNLISAVLHPRCYDLFPSFNAIAHHWYPELNASFGASVAHISSANSRTRQASNSSASCGFYLFIAHSLGIHVHVSSLQLSNWGTSIHSSIEHHTNAEPSNPWCRCILVVEVFRRCHFSK
jgi:hypothetical protein